MIVDLENDVYRLGLRSRMPEAQTRRSLEPHPRGARRFPRACRQEQAEHYVEMFDPDRYVVNASVKENLVFGVAETRRGARRASRRPSLHVDHRRDGARGKARHHGAGVAETLIDLFGDLAPNNPLLERMDLMAPEEIDTYRAIVRRAANVAPKRSIEQIVRRCSVSPTAISSRGNAMACSMTTCSGDRRGARAFSAPICPTI